MLPFACTAPRFASITGLCISRYSEQGLLGNHMHTGAGVVNATEAPSLGVHTCRRAHCTIGTPKVARKHSSEDARGAASWDRDKDTRSITLRCFRYCHSSTWCSRLRAASSDVRAVAYSSCSSRNT